MVSADEASLLLRDMITLSVSRLLGLRCISAVPDAGARQRSAALRGPPAFSALVMKKERTHTLATLAPGRYCNNNQLPGDALLQHPPPGGTRQQDIALPFLPQLKALRVQRRSQCVAPGHQADMSFRSKSGSVFSR